MSGSFGKWLTPGFSAFLDEKYLWNCGCCGKLKCVLKCRCGTCYCSEECQKRARPVHKRMCGSIDSLINFCKSDSFKDFNYPITGFECMIWDIPEEKIDLFIDGVRKAGLRGDLIVHDNMTEKIIRIGTHDMTVQLLSNRELVEHLGSPKYNSLNSGCRMIGVLPLLFFLDSNITVNGEIVAMLLISLYSVRLEQFYTSRKCKSTCIFLDNEIPNGRIHNCGVLESYLSDIIKSNRSEGERAAIYLVHILPSIEALTKASAKTKHMPNMESLTPDEASEYWNESTKQKSGGPHNLAIVILNGEAFVIQSYYGHYTYNEWLDFDNDLKLAEVPATALENWHHKILKRPKFRGKMNMEQLLKLTDSISSLTNKGDHIDTFAQITGIVHDRKTIDKSYLVGFIRVDLDRQLLYNK